MTEKYKGIYVGDCLIIHDENGELKVEEVLNRLNRLADENEELHKKINEESNTITYRKLEDIISDALEGYMNMLQTGMMTFNEFVIIENVLMKINEGISK
ncbi:MAG: hypothetical protein J6A15_00475 [Clostridia bacterium]|nr:hypothetical protein [Clostridia bacterium]